MVRLSSENNLVIVAPAGAWRDSGVSEGRLVAGITDGDIEEKIREGTSGLGGCLQDDSSERDLQSPF
jgi:hypothetical protein